MSKLNIVVTLRLFVAAIALALVSCGGQPIQSEDAVPAEKVPDASDAVSASETAAPQKEPEPPSVELIPRKDLDEPKISMEPLPADAPVEAKQEIPAEKIIDSETADAVNKDQTETKEPEKEEPPLVATPAVTPVPASVDALEKAPLAQIPAQKAQPPVPAPILTPSVPVGMPTDPNTFLVTVGAKAAPHPSLGKGHALGFLINGVSGKRLVLERGKSYTFDIRTDPRDKALRL